MILSVNQLLIEHCVESLKHSYQETYSLLEPHFPNIIEWTGRLALENIANSDSLYHNVEHTVMVALVGQAILKGKHISEGGVTPSDWLHFTMALLTHDIGYVRGVCRADRPGHYATGIGDEMIEVSDDYTDSALTPYHLDRSKRFVYERFGGQTLVQDVNPDIIAALIERTRFPVPNDPAYRQTGDYPGLLRAADYIGQLGDPGYLRKIPALYYEFQENGVNEQIGYRSPGHMRRAFTKFYWDVVYPFIPDALRYLNVTQEGKQWIAHLYAHVHQVEHELR